MTKEEAIETLKANYPDTCYEQLREAVDAAIEALKAQDVPDTNVGNNNDTIYRQTAIDARRYTFGNDEFSLEAAYHDCKLVFDGITDDDSFQEADTGLILYYANEIIYALHEALEGKDTNVLSNDCISRQAAIDLIDGIETERLKGTVELIYAPAIKGLRALPSAQLEQPEIIRCKDCKYSHDEYGDGDCYCKRPGRMMDWLGQRWDFYCADAKRRADD